MQLIMFQIFYKIYVISIHCIFITLQFILLNKVLKKIFFFNKTPLHYAAEKNNLDVVQYLLSLDGIDPNIKDKILYIYVFIMFKIK